MNFTGLGIDEDFLNNGTPINLDNLGSLDGAKNMLGGMSTEQRDQISDVFNQEMSSVIDFKLWVKIIELQKKLNNRVSPEWEADTKQEKYDTWMAILDETVEVLGSKKWKWWKDTAELGSIDWDNVQVELIDIFHFMLSISIQLKQQDSIFMTLMAFQKNKLDGKSAGFNQQEFFDKFWSEFLMAVWQKSIPLVVVKWCEFYYLSGGDFNNLVRDYFIKNALNHIRQEFGYSSGKYQKMWRHPSNPSKLVEDNVVAGELLKSTSDLTEDSVTEMEKVLRKYYLEFVSI